MNTKILLPKRPLALKDLKLFQNNPFEDYIKFVVDIKNNRIGLGGFMHVDIQELLLNSGSSSDDLWGLKLWPWDTIPYIEYSSQINDKPKFRNHSLNIQNPAIRAQVFNILKNWVQLDY